jgi:hypothetical protein
MTKAVKETRGRKPYKNGGQGGGWQRLSSQLANVFDKAIEKHGGQDALAQTIASEIDESPSDSLTAALSNVQQALEVQRSEKAQVIEAEYREEHSENEKAD